MTDAELVDASMHGNLNAYGQIVERYKSLICAMLYTRTGDLGLSQDLAQETFLAAWWELPELRDTSKFRQWLCSIAKNLASSSLRKRSRDVVAHAEDLEGVPEPAANAPTPCEHAISKEQESLLWAAIERIPEVYRLPLVLYYREGRSVERVAADLGISSDAVKQRLLRGRRMLQEHVEQLVERSLAQTRPAEGFTLAVLSTISLSGVSVPARLSATSARTGGNRAGHLGVRRLVQASADLGSNHVIWAALVVALALVAGLGIQKMRSGAGQPDTVAPMAHTMDVERVQGPVMDEPRILAAVSSNIPETAPALPSPEPDVRDMTPSSVPTRSVVSRGYPGVQYDMQSVDAIEGTVYDPAGVPLAEAKVSAVRYGLGALQVFECESGPNGGYRLVVPAGQWAVKAQKGSLGGEAEPEVWGQVIAEGRGQTIQKSIRTKPRCVLRGLVSDEQTGDPIREGAVYTLHQCGDTLMAAVDNQGRYELEGIEQREQYLIAVCPGYERICILTNTALRNEAQLDIRLKPAAKITGVVTDLAGHPLAHAWVARDLLNTGNVLYHYEVCDEQGRFEYDGLPFDKELRLTALYPCYLNGCASDAGPEGEWVGTIPANAAGAPSITIPVPGEQPVEARAYWRGTYPAIEGVIRGRVTAPDGKPVHNFRVLLQWPHALDETSLRPFMSIDFWIRGFSFTSEEGDFILGVPGVTPGQLVRVVALADGYSQGVADAVPVTPFGAVCSGRALALRLRKIQTLSVQVIEEGGRGRPVGGALVTVSDVTPWSDEAFRWHSADMWRPVSAVTDSQGWARFQNLELTAGTVTAKKDGWGRGHVEWRNGESSLSVALSTECVLSGVLLDAPSFANGRPVSVGLVKLDRLPDGIYELKNAAIESFENAIKPNDNGTFHFVKLPPGYYRLATHWWKASDGQGVSCGDEFLLQPGDTLTVTYPDDSVFQNPGRWLSERTGDDQDEEMRQSLIGTWYHDILHSDGTSHRAVYDFSEDGRTERRLLYPDHPSPPPILGYFKVFKGCLKTVEQDRFPYDARMAFNDADTLWLGWMTTEPPLIRARKYDPKTARIN